MKNLIFLLFLSIVTLMVSCNDDNNTTVIDSSKPSGKFTIQREGTFTAQNGTPTTGMAEIGIDEKGEQFVHFDSDFKTELVTGTVTVYLSKGQTLKLDPANGNPDARAIGIVSQNGENYFKVENLVSADFTHVIIWCGSASIPFGYAPLQ